MTPPVPCAECGGVEYHRAACSLIGGSKSQEAVDVDAAAAKVRAASEAERAAFEICAALPYGPARIDAWLVWRDAQGVTFAAAGELFTLTRAQRAARRA